MLTAFDLDRLRSLAEQLQVRLQRAGPSDAGCVCRRKIMTAILIARGEYGARAACRLIPGVPDEGAHNFVGTLAQRVGMLLSPNSTPVVSSAESAAVTNGASVGIITCFYAFHFITHNSTLLANSAF